MPDLPTLFASGRIIDIAVALVIVEALLVTLHHRRTGRGPAAADFLINLTSGLFLMLALRCALVGAAWPWIALLMAGGLIAHLADLRRRWRG